MMMQVVIAVTGTCAVAVLWALAQLAWRRAFPAGSGDPDALAGRTDCHRCERDETCLSTGRESCN